MKKMMTLSFMMLLSFSAFGFDQSGKTAVGVTGGRTIPVGSSKFNDEAEPGLAYGGFVRHHINPNWGVDLGMTRLDYEKICTCTRSNVFDALGFYRIKGAEDLSPVVGLGLGVVENGKNQNLHLGVRLRGGVEKAFTQSVAVGAYVDYQSISKMIGANRGPLPSNMGVLVPKLEMTWTFGN